MLNESVMLIWDECKTNNYFCYYFIWKVGLLFLFPDMICTQAKDLFLLLKNKTKKKHVIVF